MARFHSLRRFRQSIRHCQRRGHRSRRPAVVELLESRALLAAQVVTPAITATPLTVGQPLNVTLNYDVQDPAANAPTGLGLRLHYDSSVLQFNSISNVLQDGFSTSEDRLEDVDDGNIRTDRVVNILWLKLVGDWPGDSLPTSLLTAQFTALATADSSAINFTGETSPGYNFTSTSVAIDNVAPTVNVDIADASLSNADDTSVVTFEFSESVTGFDVNDVNFSNGTLTNFSAVDNNTFTATFTADNGVVATGSVNVTASSYTDAAGNTGPAGSDNVSVETIDPTVTVNIVDTTLSDSDNSSNVTFEFSETVLGFTAGDVAVSGGTLSELAPIDGDSFTATFTAANGTSATGSVTVGASSYTDAAGNTGSSGTDDVSIDTLNPTVVITPNGTTTSENSILFTFQFSEAISEFVAGDVGITNGSAGVFTPVDGDTFTLEVFAASPGTVTVSVAAGVAQDTAGNLNTSASASVTSSAAGAVALPGGNTYEVLINGGDLVVRIAGGAEQFRRVVDSVSVLKIAGSPGADLITIRSSGGAVATPILFTGDGGDDLFDASLATGPTTLIGGGGDDTLTGGTVDDFIIGGSGKDVISGNAGNDRIDGRNGRDTLTGGSGNDTLRGGSGPDTIVGSQDADVLGGGGGPDTITGGDGNDRILGGPGQDLLDGNEGDDTLNGGGGADDIAGGLGDDTLNRVFRNDAFNQVVGRDTLIGGQRPAGHPAPVNPLVPESEPESAQFLSSSTLTKDETSDVQRGTKRVAVESLTSIDAAFANSVEPELLGL